MRRALPWLTVGLLVLGLGAGTGLGIAGQTSTPIVLTASGQIARIVAATRAARTARFSYSSTTVSTNRLLRQFTRGTGEVNFASDAMRTAERDRSTGFSGTTAATAKDVAQDTLMDNVWIGRTEYSRFMPETNLSLETPWIKTATWPKNSFGPLGVLGQTGPLTALALDASVPGIRVEAAGSGMVRGVETQEYRIVVPLCGTAGHPDGISTVMAPLHLWVDSQGRLVRARQSDSEDITKQAHLGNVVPGEGFLVGRSTTVSTIDLGDFGAPAAITAPAPMNSHSSGHSVFITLKRAHCR
jgi:hypothetical protein